MARYTDAIKWIVTNDDTNWLDGEPGTADGQESVTAALIADLFEKTDIQVRADLIDETRKQQQRRTRMVAQGLRGNNYR